MRQIRRNSTALLTLKGITLDSSFSALDLLQSIQKLSHIVYLAKLDAEDKVKVRNYMTEAEAELGRLKRFVTNLSPPNSPPQIN